MDNALRKTQIENIDVQVARAFLSKLHLTKQNVCTSDSDIFYVNKQIKCQYKKIIIENVQFQDLCQKSWALKKWCVTKVAHCIP